jgi:hypothetical protein
MHAGGRKSQNCDFTDCRLIEGASPSYKRSTQVVPDLSAGTANRLVNDFQVIFARLGAVRAKSSGAVLGDLYSGVESSADRGRATVVV